MAAKGWNVRDLVRESGVDAGTLGDFLSGQRWPRIATRGRIESALGWDPGTISAIEDGENVGPPDQAAEYVSRADALRDATKDELLAEIARRIAEEPS